MGTKERAFWRAAAFIFALFIIVLYFPVLFGKIPFPRDLVLQFPTWAGRIPSQAIRSYGDIGDLVTFFYPTRAFAAQSVKHGVLPLWNPLLLSGEPFLANAQSSLFYPPNVLYYILPLPAAWTACLLLRMFLSAVFMAIFVRSIGGSKTGSIFAGIVFASCGFMTAWQGQPMTDSAIWLPFVCYAVQRLHKNVSGTAIAMAAAGFAMPVLAGHPETAAHVTLTGTALAAMLCLWAADASPRRFALRFIFGFAVVGVLALGLASIQIIPTLEWLKQFGEEFGVWPSLPASQALGWLSRDILRSPNSAGVHIPEGAAYMAMISIVAAPLAVLHRPRVYSVFLSIVAVCAIAIAYGFEPMQTVVSHIPVFRGLKNYRMLVGNFAIAGLGALGISVLEESIFWTQRKRLAALALIGSMFTLTLILNHQVQLATKFKAEVMHRPSFSRTLLILSLLVLVWKLWGGLRGKVFGLVVCSFAAFDLGTFAFGYMGFASRDEIFPPAPAFDFLLHQDDSQFRIIQVGLPYSSNAPLMYGLRSADGYEVALSGRQRAFVEDLIDRNSNGINFLSDRILERTDRRLDLLNVKYVLLPAFVPDFKRFLQSNRFVQAFNNGSVAIFENPAALPSAWVVSASGVEIVRDLTKEVNRLKSPAFDPMKSVTVSEAPQLFSVPDAASDPFSGSAKVVESDARRVAIKTEASSPAILIFSQMYYPGWKAMIDHRPSQIVPVDVALIGIPVPAGVHEVVLVFQPLSFRIGLGLTTLSIVVLLAIVALDVRSRRETTARNKVMV